jgi:hypothetical protein
MLETFLPSLWPIGSPFTFFFSPFILTPPIVLLGMGLALFLEMGFGLAYLAATCYLIHTEMHLSLYTYLSFSGLCQISSGLSRNQKGV